MNFLELLFRSFLCKKKELAFTGIISLLSDGVEALNCSSFPSPWRTGEGLEASNSLGPMRNHKKQSYVLWLALLPSWPNTRNDIEVHDIKGGKKLPGFCQFCFYAFCHAGLEDIS